MINTPKKIPIKVVSTTDADILQIRFFPTDICNFNCSYCFPGSHDEKYRYPKDVDRVVANFRKLFDMYTNQLGKTKFHLLIAGGGEPTLWPHLEQFCKEVRESHNVYITIVTNGSRTIRWWEENSAYFDDVVLSCHSEYVDIEHYVNVADLLFAAELKVTGLMVMNAQQWDRCLSYIDRMLSSQHPWYIETKPVVDAPGYGTDVYTQEQLDYINSGLKRIPNSEWIFKRLDEIKTHESIVLFSDDTAMAARPSEIITNGWNKFKGWSCNIGFEALSVTASGEVSASCQLVVFNKPLNIFDEEFNTQDIIPSQIICTLNDCNCQPDTHVTKTKVD
jgi:wyosine [tRNA(Phe)-imidazoG37] synthetase (radical SAM superfamily)